jgi:hypothetical protein
LQALKKPLFTGLYVGLLWVWCLVVLWWLLSDTKLTENISQQIIGIYFSGYVA